MKKSPAFAHVQYLEVLLCFFLLENWTNIVLQCFSSIYKNLTEFYYENYCEKTLKFYSFNGSLRILESLTGF
jgi:hypothetical protein